MMLIYTVLTLYGSSLLYNEVQLYGCDPSDNVYGNISCEADGPSVFGAMLGIMFSAMGLSQVSNVIEQFTAARVASNEALQSIKRCPGDDGKVIYDDNKNDNDNDKNHNNDNLVNDSMIVVGNYLKNVSNNNSKDKTNEHHCDDDDENDITTNKAGTISNNTIATIPSASTLTDDKNNHNNREKSFKNGKEDRIIKAILPKYEINSLSLDGYKPKNIIGRIVFDNVSFSYPTRPNNPILNGLSLEIEAGKTIALVGPR